MSSRSEKLLYDAAAMSPVRILQVLAVTFGLAACGLTYWLLRAPPGAAPTSLAPTLIACVMAAAAIASPVAALVYGRRIATRIFLLPDNATLRVFHTSLVGETQREIGLRDVSVLHADGGDAAGEEKFSPQRIEVDVHGGQNFVVVFSRGSVAQRQNLLQALRSQPGPRV